MIFLAADEIIMLHGKLRTATASSAIKYDAILGWISKYRLEQ